MHPGFVLAGVLLAAVGSAQAGTYRWVDKSGDVHYGDVPEEEAVQIEQKKFSIAPEPEDADLPYVTRLARQNFPVTFYSFNNCGDICQQARDFLNKRGVPYTETNLVTQKDVEAFKLKSGNDSVPALSVGRTWLKGFEVEEWNNELDVAGYPKTAPYRSQASSAVPPSQPAAK